MTPALTLISSMATRPLLAALLPQLQAETGEQVHAEAVGGEREHPETGQLTPPCGVDEDTVAVLGRGRALEGEAIGGERRHRVGERIQQFSGERVARLRAVHHDPRNRRVGPLDNDRLELFRYQWILPGSIFPP
jgi:hypothetical protein